MSDVEPIDLDDLKRVGVKVREKTDDNWLADMVELARDEIARLREERRWVSVGERLPKEGVDVLVMVNRRCHVAGFETFDNGHVHWTLASFESVAPSHWQSLPPGEGCEPMTASEFNFSAHSPQFVGGPLDGSAWNLPPTVEAVEMRSGRVICRYKRKDKDTFVFEEAWPLPPGPEGEA